MFSAPFTRPGKQSGNYINRLVKMNILFLIEIVTCIKMYEFALFSTILGMLSRNSSFVSAPDLAVLSLDSFFGDNTKSIIIMKLS